MLAENFRACSENPRCIHRALSRQLAVSQGDYSNADLLEKLFSVARLFSFDAQKAP
jgi:hypothetical protein